MQKTRRQILTAIADGPVSGPELADRLDVSRAAVWKHVESLREAGFEIPNDDGYVLEAIPEFGGPAVEFQLDAPFEVEYHDRIASTNDRARELADEGRENVVVLADEQTGGRGRRKRAWSSPAGGVWLSLLVRPDVPAMQAPVYTLAAAVATARAVRDVGVDASIKWPNDVLVDGEKLAGILTEMEGEADSISWLIVGIGLNANFDPAALPDDRPVTTIREQVGDVNRRHLTQTILEEFATLTDDSDAVLSAWRELTTTLGRRVRVETAGEEIVGEAVDVRFPGTLVIDTGDEQVEVTTGDCEHLRPDE